MSETPAPFARNEPTATLPDWATNPQWQREVDGMGTMYTLGALASAIDRTPVSVRKWESEGIFPKTPWIGTRGLRLYTYEIIAALVLLASRAEMIGNFRTPSENLRWFSAAAHHLFKEVAPHGAS